MRAFWACVVLFAMLLFGCGGGGGGGGGSGTFSVVRVELPNRDTINIVVGQQVVFVLAGYDAFSGQRIVLTANSWSVTGNPAVGTIDSSGRFTASSPGTAQIHA